MHFILALIFLALTALLIIRARSYRSAKARARLYNFERQCLFVGFVFFAAMTFLIVIAQNVPVAIAGLIAGIILIITSRRRRLAKSQQL